MIKYLIVILFILLRGVFAAVDTALVYTDKYKVAKMVKKDKKSEKIKFLIEDKIRFWGVIEIGIISVELFLTAFVAEEFTNRLANNIQAYGIGNEIATIISVFIITLILTFVLLVFGTILPKQIARNNPEKIAYQYITALWIFSKINHPFEWIVKQVTKTFSWLLNIEQDPESRLTEKQIKMIIAEGKEQGALENLEKQIAIKALNFDDIKIKNIMIKKENVDFLNIEADSKEILNNINEYKFTRIPVYKDNIETKENILGIFNIKDLIVEYSKTNRMNLKIERHLKEIDFSNRNEDVADVFKRMQKNKIAMTIVLDENDNVCGLATIEDMLETLVGKIFDEYEKNMP